MTRDDIRQILMQVRPYFRDHLGKFTHKRISDDWYFHALGFIRDDMTYVFGFNLGFFDCCKESELKNVGMSVTIRANGLSPEIRQGYLDFFSRNLKSWSSHPYERYTSERGGEGLLIKRYADTKNMTSEQMVTFLKESIDEFHKIYPEIVKNSKLFTSVMRAQMPWDEPLVALVQEKI